MNLSRTRQPVLRADFKQQPHDFLVDEQLGFECTGDGEHVWVLIRKTGINTVEAAQRLARAAGVSLKDVSWSGLKDRHGVCRQWLSLQLPGRATPDFMSVISDELHIERIERNNRKLRRGSHRSNRFMIRLRHLRPDTDVVDLATGLAALEQALIHIRQQGVPNYFGEQRFGFDNINKAQAWFNREYRPQNTTERGLLLSAARAAIFNVVLSERVSAGHWNRYLDGDVMNLDGSASVFQPEAGDDQIVQRIETMDIHPTGPLWGRPVPRSPSPQAACAELEGRVAERFPGLADGLVRHQVEASRRSLRLPVQALHYRLLENQSPTGPDLELSFELPSGTYATAVLHDLIEYQRL
ncbi:tRNA pseudouridine(13) synthase TruD [Gammaproteobacteria bacterium LSUCC0112]|nr:tRNA pseudouridine(13) synthase TruD [Gammaproteobacteria bacterium LSUCC0112]